MEIDNEEVMVEIAEDELILRITSDEEHSYPFQGIQLHDRFHSFQELEKTIREVEKKTNVALYKRDCRLLGGRDTPKKHEHKDFTKFPYHYVHYSCKFGGRKFIPAPKLEGKRTRKCS